MALVSASVATGSPQYEKHGGTCDSHDIQFHRHRARQILKHAYESQPSRAEIEAYQVHRRCIRDEDVRASLAALRDRLKAKLEAEQLAASVTPYDCGSHGNFAIPCYVVDCESHFDWGAVNPSSGARSVYQMLPSTYSGVCDTCDWSHPDQHVAASRVWARSGGGEWSCA